MDAFEVRLKLGTALYWLRLIESEPDLNLRHRSSKCREALDEVFLALFEEAAPSLNAEAAEDSK